MVHDPSLALVPVLAAVSLPTIPTINVPCASEKSVVIVRRCNVMYGLNLRTVLHDDNSLTRVISRTRCTWVITEVNIASKIHTQNPYFSSLHIM